jgi:glycosyltransferase involved in cell wall biosynthesis
MASTKIEGKSSAYPSVSVVIPTLGRESLRQAISSVLDQTVKPLEVLVICHDSLKSNKIIVDVARKHSVRILTNRFGTVSENRNQGIQEAQGDYVAFLDDDDYWLPKKLEMQLDFLASDAVDLVSCRAQYRGWKNAVVPVVTYSDSREFLDSLYGNWNFGSRKFGMPTPTIILNARIAKEHLFEICLDEREDLLFVDKIEQAGFKLAQLEEVLVEVKSSKPFTNRATTIANDIYWFKYLSDRPSKLNWKFLFTVALRNRLVRLQFYSFIELLSNALKVSFRK